MKVFIILASFVAVASAGKTHYASGPLVAAAPLPVAGPLASTGSSSQFRSEDNYGNFNFGYDESHATGATSRREEQVNGIRRGSYSLSDADGRRRLVNYVADATGFHATIESNEPGVEPKDPADVLINKPAPVAVVAAPVAPAPVFAAPAPLPAPVAALPAPVAVKGYVQQAPLAAAPAVVVEAPAPRAFSYSFGATHLAPAHLAAAPLPIAAPAPLPLPAPQQAPFWQQRVAY